MGMSILTDGMFGETESQIKPPFMDRYASGHKQAVLKAVQWPKKSPVGSNPTLSFRNFIYLYI